MKRAGCSNFMYFSELYIILSQSQGNLNRFSLQSQGNFRRNLSQSQGKFDFRM